MDIGEEIREKSAKEFKLFESKIATHIDLIRREEVKAGRDERQVTEICDRAYDRIIRNNNLQANLEIKYLLRELVRSRAVEVFPRDTSKNADGSLRPLSDVVPENISAPTPQPLLPPELGSN